MVEALRKNGYPNNFIHKQSHPRDDRTSQQDGEMCAIWTFPYISGLLELIRRFLSPLSIQVPFSPLKTLKQELVHPRTQFKCRGRELSTACRVPPHLHRPNVEVSGHAPTKIPLAIQKWDVAATAVAEHVFKVGHKVDL